MYRLLHLLVTLSFTISNALKLSKASYADYSDDEHVIYAINEDMKVPRLYALRCTRRYNAGACSEPVRSVWTYEYDLQNCTERLGCEISKLSNRFPTYGQCVRRCQALSDIYTRVMGVESEDGRQEAFLGRRSGNITEWNRDWAVEDKKDYETDNSMRPVVGSLQDYDLADARGARVGYDVTGDVDSDVVLPDVDSFEMDALKETEIRDFYKYLKV